MDRETKKIVLKTLDKLKEFDESGIAISELNGLEDVTEDILNILELHDLIEYEDAKCFLTQFAYEVLEEGLIEVAYKREKHGGLATALKEFSKDFEITGDKPKKEVKKKMWILLAVIALALTYYTVMH